MVMGHTGAVVKCTDKQVYCFVSTSEAKAFFFGFTNLHRLDANEVYKMRAAALTHLVCWLVVFSTRAYASGGHVWFIRDAFAAAGACHGH